MDYQAFVSAVFRWKPGENASFKRVADAAEEEEEKRVWRELEQKARSRLGTVPTLSQLLEDFDMRSKDVAARPWKGPVPDDPRREGQGVRTRPPNGLSRG